MRLATAVAALAALACLAPARGEARPARSRPYAVEVIDGSGRTLPTFHHRGRSYVLGRLGERYAVRVWNDGPRRVEAVVSVDGRDVMDGRPADLEKRGYLVEPGATLTVDGFRLSDASVAAFRFSSVPRSYAALTGDARDVGVIGVAVFREREWPRPLRTPHRPESSARNEAAPGERAPATADVAPSPPTAPRKSAERPGLGTAFGEERDAPLEHVAFERASSRPDAVLTVRYDDREGLLAAGVDLDPRWRRDDEAGLRETADPFRGSAYAEPPPGWRGGR